METLEKQIRRVGMRWGVNLLLDKCAWSLLLAGIIAAAVVVVGERLLAWWVTPGWSWGILLGAAGVVSVVLWLRKWPGRMQAALLIDERLKIQERFSSALALAGDPNPFARAACDDARQTAERVNMKGHFPIRPPERWPHATGIWLVAILAALFMPQMDLLGYLKQQEDEDTHKSKVKRVKTHIKASTDTVKLVVKELGDPDLADELAKLDEAGRNAKPGDIKLQAIKKLGDIADRVKDMQSGPKLDSMRVMQQMLKQLQGAQDSFSQKLRTALAKGEFGQARDLLNEMRKELAEKNLSGQQQKRIAQQLQNLAKELDELARSDAELEKELEKLGLSKKLAKLDAAKLREALLKQGLTAEQIEKLLKKAAACRMGQGRCGRLGSGMAACGVGAGLGEDELAALVGQLDELESLEQQLQLMAASLAEIDGAIGCLGNKGCRGGCQGACKKPWQAGQSDRYGLGTGGPGRGYGAVDTDPSGKVSSKSTRVQNKSKEGPIIASWYFKDAQVKGEAQRDYAQVMQAARDGAAEAITNNAIPRKYEDSVKQYFDELE